MARLLGCIRVYKNWPVHYLDQFGIGIRYRQPVELRLRNGLTQQVRGRTSDLSTARSIFIDESYLPPPLEIPEDATVIDIGGHIGSFTMFAAVRARKGRVFAYEPEAANFNLLMENLRRNGLDHAKGFNLAVSDQEGDRRMFYALRDRGTGGHSFYGRGDRTFGVRCTTLPRILDENRIDVVDFLKLDCEGSEIEILNSLSDAQLGAIRQIAMELHHPDRFAPILERLRSAGHEEIPASKRNYRYFRKEA